MAMSPLPVHGRQAAAGGHGDLFIFSLALLAMFLYASLNHDISEPERARWVACLRVLGRPEGTGGRRDIISSGRGINKLSDDVSGPVRSTPDRTCSTIPSGPGPFLS